MYYKWLLSFSSSGFLLLNGNSVCSDSDLGLLRLRSGFWSTLSIGICVVVEAKRSSAHGLEVEKQFPECPASTSSPLASGQRGFIPPFGLLLGFQMQGDQAKLIHSHKPIAPFPQEPTVSEDHLWTTRCPVLLQDFVIKLFETQERC